MNAVKHVPYYRLLNHRTAGRPNANQSHNWLLAYGEHYRSLEGAANGPIATMTL